MGIPVYSIGQILDADDVNTWLVPKAVFKTADETVTSSTTLQNDDELVLPVAANAGYEFNCWVEYLATSGSDIKWSWAVPASATLEYSALHSEGGGTGFSNSHLVYADTDTPMAAGSAPTVTAISMRGKLSTAGSSGSLQFKWAQNTSGGTATHVRVKSWLRLDRIG